jgi:phage gp36-like protein
MAYITQEDLEAAIGVSTVLDLVDDDGNGGHNTATVARITAAIERAQNLIDGYVQAHYLVPFTDGAVPPMVQNWAVTIAIWYLYRRRRNAFQIPDDVRADWERVEKQLVMANSGKLDLGTEPPPASSTKVAAASSGPDQLMTHDTLKDL